MRVGDDGKCIKHGFGQIISTHTQEIVENEDDEARLFKEKITTETIYIGYWEDDKRCGLGKQFKRLIYDNQKERGRRIEYVGPFKNDLENGEGIQLQYSEVDFEAFNHYRGKISSDNRDLKDTFCGDYLELVEDYEKDDTYLHYKGGFVDGKKDGKGVETWNSIARFVGEFKIGKKNGEGKYTSFTGDEYVGGYRDDKRWGKGTSKEMLFYSDGSPGYYPHKKYMKNGAFQTFKCNWQFGYK